MPLSPGVYLFKDARSRVIYVGKASRLRNRVRSYFGSQTRFSPKVLRLVEHVFEFEFFVTATEEEALVLELNLIKKFRPRYNISLKDDKTFPYLKIDSANEYPRVTITRRVANDGARYFGPFASAASVRVVLNLIKRIFPFRSCTKPITGSDRRPCLDFHIRRCVGPCVGAVTRAEYGDVIRRVTLFLEGRLDTVLNEMKSRMDTAAGELQFEKAALLRDQIRAVERVIQEQGIATTVRGDQDVVGFARSGDFTTVEVFFVRGSKLIGREHFTLEGTRGESPSQIMSVFVKQFYGSAANVPPLLLLQHPIEDVATIQNWLAAKRGAKASIVVPRKGGRKRLVEIVAENARQEQEQRRIRDMATATSLSEAMDGLRRSLHLPSPPRRIECYDISSIQGTNAVGSMVVFENGNPAREHYRRFRIKTVSGTDDYAMMREVLERRFRHHMESNGISEETWGTAPDLVLIDGGKGHLAIAVDVLKEAGLSHIPVASIAKEHEEVFSPGLPTALALPDGSALHLLQRIRDEAHRFAVSYHRDVRSRQSKRSLLDTIPGIGPKRRRALLKRFGSALAVAAAATEDLAAVEGMNKSAAEKVKQYLHNLPL